MLDKKGFLFTVTVFLILTYILLSISVWVKSVEASERAFSEFYKESTVELTIEQITPAKADNVTYIIMNRALARLNDHSIQNPVLEGPENDPNQNIRLAMGELLTSGTASGNRFTTGTPMVSEANSSLSAWASSLNASLRAMGVYVSEYSVSGVTINQTSVNRINYSFNMRLALRDTSGTSSVSRTYRVSNALDITGLVDPALARDSTAVAGENKTIYRQFFFNPDAYGTPSDVRSAAVSRLRGIDAGQGWLYAPLATVAGSADKVPNAASVSAEDRGRYMLVGSYSEIVNYQDYEFFGGYIVTSSPSHPTACTDDSGRQYPNEDSTFNTVKYYGVNCTNSSITGAGIQITAKPFAVAPGFDVLTAPECPLVFNETMGRCILMVSGWLPKQVWEPDKAARKFDVSKGGIYDVEGIRDFTMCGYYTRSGYGPSYMQRLMNGSFARTDQAYGLETFVIGNYANDYGVYDTHSRLDRELLNPAIAVKIRGMPGCRDWSSCSDSPVTGVFAVSPGVVSSYGLDSIACNNGAAGCD